MFNTVSAAFVLILSVAYVKRNSNASARGRTHADIRVRMKRGLKLSLNITFYILQDANTVTLNCVRSVYTFLRYCWVIFLFCVLLFLFISYFLGDNYILNYTLDSSVLFDNSWLTLSLLLTDPGAISCYSFLNVPFIIHYLSRRKTH